MPDVRPAVIQALRPVSDWEKIPFRRPKVERTMSRHSKNKTPWGLVLMGGGARGLAHIGVLEVFEKNGLVPDVVTGTSMGAIIGGFYAAGVPLKDMRRLAADLSFKKYISPRVYSILSRRRNPVLDYFLLDLYLQKVLGKESGLVGDRVEGYLRRFVGDVDIERLPVRFACNAVDVLSGRERLFTEGKLYKAVRASMSYPLAFKPARHEKAVLLDGGIVNNVPVEAARDLGAEKVLVSDVHRPVKPVPASKIGNALDLLQRVVHIAMTRADEDKLRAADFVLEVNPEVEVFDFSRVRAVIGRGRQAAEARLQDIRNWLAGAGPGALK